MPACAINSLTRGKTICCRLRSVDAHDQQKRTLILLKWNFDEVVLSYDSHNSQWRSADACKGHSFCQRIGHILDNESLREYASSLIAWKALRRTRTLFRVDQRSKTTSHLKRYSDTVQHGELRSYRGSWFVNEFFLQFSLFNVHDTFKAGN